jgi:glycosyltransferase involved in cell wall biosynthesis
MNGESIKVVVVPPRVCGTFKTALYETIHLSQIGVPTSLVTNSRGMTPVRVAYDSLLDSVSLEYLPPSRFLSTIMDTATRRYRTVQGTGRKSEIDIDLGSAIKSNVYARRIVGMCSGMVFHNVLSAMSALPEIRKVRNVLYIHSQPIADQIRLLSVSKRLASVIKQIEKLIVHNADKLMADNMIVAGIIKREFGRSCHVIYNGCTPAENIATERDSIIFSVNRWDVDRGIPLLLEIMTKLKETPFRLVMAGSWASQELLSWAIREISARGLNDKITITGPIDETELFALYQKARCMVYPVYALFGYSALEAAANGIPFVMPKGSGAWEVFEPGRHGFAAEENSAPSFSDCLMNFLDEDVSVSMGCKIWKKAKEMTWEHHARQLHMLLRSC